MCVWGLYRKQAEQAEQAVTSGTGGRCNPPPPALLHHAPRSTPPAAKSIAWERGGALYILRTVRIAPPVASRAKLPHLFVFLEGGWEGPIGTCRKMRYEPFAGTGGELRVSSFCFFVMPRNRHMTERDIMPPSSSPSSSLPWPRTMPDRQGLPELPALLASSFRVTACPRSSPPSPPAAGSNLERLPVSLFSSFPYCILKGV